MNCARKRDNMQWSSTTTDNTGELRDSQTVFSGHLDLRIGAEPIDRDVNVDDPELSKLEERKNAIMKAIAELDIKKSATSPHIIDRLDAERATKKPKDDNSGFIIQTSSLYLS